MEYTPVQEAANMFAALLFAVLFLGGLLGLLGNHLAGRLMDHLDGKNGEKPLIYKDFSNSKICKECAWPIDDNGKCLCENKPL